MNTFCIQTVLIFIPGSQNRLDTVTNTVGIKSVSVLFGCHIYVNLTELFNFHSVLCNSI